MCPVCCCEPATYGPSTSCSHFFCSGCCAQSRGGGGGGGGEFPPMCPSCRAEKGNDGSSVWTRWGSSRSRETFLQERGAPTTAESSSSGSWRASSATLARTSTTTSRAPTKTGSSTKAVVHYCAAVRRISYRQRGRCGVRAVRRPKMVATAAAATAAAGAGGAGGAWGGFLGGLLKGGR